MNPDAILLILGIHFAVAATPGPSTLAIMSISMGSGRSRGLTFSVGIVLGSIIWSVMAAFGLAAVISSYAWILETVRYCGAAYLAYLAYTCAKAAIGGPDAGKVGAEAVGYRRAFLLGLAIHLTNPKVILYFGSLYVLLLASDTNPPDLALVVGLLAILSTVVFCGYAVVFSSQAVRRAYRRISRWFNGAVSVLFAMAAVRLLFADLK